MKILKRVFLAMVLSVLLGGFSEAAFAAEDILSVTPFATADEVEFSLKNGETHTIRKMVYRDTSNCTNYLHDIRALSGSSESVVLSVTRDDGSYISPPIAGQITNFAGYGTNGFEKYVGVSWINQNITNISGGTVTFKVRYNAKIVFMQYAGSDYKGL